MTDADRAGWARVLTLFAGPLGIWGQFFSGFQWAAEHRWYWLLFPGVCAGWNLGGAAFKENDEPSVRRGFRRLLVALGELLIGWMLFGCGVGAHGSDRWYWYVAPGSLTVLLILMAIVDRPARKPSFPGDSL